MGSFWKILLLAVLIFYVFTLIIKWIFRRKMKKLEEQMEARKNSKKSKSQNFTAAKTEIDAINQTNNTIVEAHKKAFLEKHMI